MGKWLVGSARIRGRRGGAPTPYGLPHDSYAPSATQPAGGVYGASSSITFAKSSPLVVSSVVSVAEAFPAQSCQGRVHRRV